MSFFEFPHTRTYDSDLGFIIKWITQNDPTIDQLTAWKQIHEGQYKKLLDMVEGLQNSLVDVIVPWDSSIAYHIFSIVEYQGQNYIAIQDVPIGAMITDTNYWEPANTVIQQINAIGNTVNEVKDAYPRRTYYRPEDYGAVVNDPAIDNAIPIQQAILDAITNKGIVLLSEGKYYTSTTITIDQRCMNVSIIGTGLSSDGNYGTAIIYSGSSYALHFSAGMWGCNIESFNINCTGAGSTALRISNDSGAGHLAVRCVFKDINIKFRYHGIEMLTAAYNWFYNVSIMADADYSDVDRIGMYLANDPNVTNDNQIEYVHFENCRIVCRLVSDSLNTYNSIGMLIKNGTHIGCFDMDITDCDYGVYFIARSGLDNGFHNFISLDVSRAHEAVRIDLDTQSLQNTIFNQLDFTPPNVPSNTDRAVRLRKISGGVSYNARLKVFDITVRRSTAVLDYFVQSDTTCLADGSCEFTFNGITVPKIDPGNRRGINPYFTTYANVAAQTVDMNDYNYAGLMPIPFASDSTNGPGFNCMILNITSPSNTTQIAIPTGSSQTFAFRIYNATSQQWGAWQMMAKQ